MCCECMRIQEDCELVIKACMPAHHYTVVALAVEIVIYADNKDVFQNFYTKFFIQNKNLSLFTILMTF